MTPPIRTSFLLTAAVLLGLTGCGTERAPAAAVPSEPYPVLPTRSAALPSSRPAPPVCTREGISIGMGQVEAAMGLRATTITLRNCGDRPYRLNGYPSLRVLDAERQPFDVKIVRGTAQIEDDGPKPLTIRPGKAAAFGIVWRNTVTDPTTTAVAGTYLEVRPAPGRPVVIVESDGPIDLGNTGRLEGTAWHLPRS
ncbi:DUF4232 domain-containing protein [Actinomadura bangladeshensis]|uniref:DUF4232 domain-containing protein n=1 Tax=Actinomadura bangladeshensis TaxID=453573 RepID=A0A6L9QJ57_9ACTN|nr:DUF4232 domain-containing protein [Actinomadura bangladeshensis]